MATTGLKIHVVSAGITGVIKESFSILQTQRELKLDDILVYVTTPEIYDESRDHAIIGFGEPTITSANKHLCMDHKRYPEIREGTNAILMGDIVEDNLIVKNLKLKEVIGIGFLNVPSEYTPETLNMFMNAYDIVIANDGNLLHPLELVKSLIGLPLDENYVKQSLQAEKFSEILK